jgi:hypothetical protein
MGTDLKGVSVYLEPGLYEAVAAAAAADARTVSQFIARRLAADFVVRPRTAVASRQVDLEDAIVAAVKRGPVPVVRRRKK